MQKSLAAFKGGRGEQCIWLAVNENGFETTSEKQAESRLCEAPYHSIDLEFYFKYNGKTLESFKQGKD